MSVQSRLITHDPQRRTTGALSKLVALQRSGRLKWAIEGQVGNWIATVGQALGSERLMFNYFMFSGFHRGALETAPHAVEGLLKLIPTPRSAIDYGSGTGVYLHELAQRGVEVRGYEHSARARAVARKLYGIETLPFDLRDFPGDDTQYDISLCIEVAHYLPPALGERLVELCANSAPRVLFSAAHPGQHGFGHVNARPKDYWIRLFEAHGFALNAPATAGLEQFLRERLTRGMWLAQNACVLERTA